ncbi:TPA: threonine--tRNA ligase [Candidatus Gracilibacteria bacterium]|nr:threonine--tRNA ligase [Candidatus Gracilibacteria bacterium]HIQ57587.1 threonine--tRNA ligase [Candidatus Gracilibacteria bacterium]
MCTSENNVNNLELCRKHTASHIMTAAVKLLYPDVKLGVGPWTDNGFYQDFDFGDVQVSEKEFKKIQKKMRWIVNKGFEMRKTIISVEKATELFGHDKFKMELISEIAGRGEDISFYSMISEGEEKDENGEPTGKMVERIFSSDLCAGPHLKNTGELGVVKLTTLASAYWRGDSDNDTLTRIYGVVFENEEKMKEYEIFLEEVAKRDHRKLGKELGLFTFSEKVGAGLPLFTPKGTFIRRKIEDTIMEIQAGFGYEKVHIPHITKKDLYEISGHWGKYKDDLFHVKGKSDTEFVMKPMNCPHHTQIFDASPKSYRDLPVRYAETTSCYRDEQAGELLGLSRVRSITQDDGHVFCTVEQIKQECKNIVEVIRQFYTKFGMYNEGEFYVGLSVRDPQKPEKYLGTEEGWSKAEQFLEEIAKEENLPYKREEGEAAFYGPKLDFQFKDAIGREWQLATIQIDFVQPENFKLSYTDKNGEKQTPVMIHRAIAGSLERFMSVIIEHFAGAFPPWLSPVQAHIIPVNEAHEEYAYDLAKKLKKLGARVEVYDASDSLAKRIRNCQTAKVPFSVIIGDNEVASGNVTVRKYGEKKDRVISIEEFLEECEG